MNDLKTEVVIKDYEGRKSVMVITLLPSKSHFSLVTILKKKNEVVETVKGPAF